MSAEKLQRSAYTVQLSEIPNTYEYGSLLKAVEFMGCERLRHIKGVDIGGGGWLETE